MLYANTNFTKKDGYVMNGWNFDSISTSISRTRESIEELKKSNDSTNKLLELWISKQDKPETVRELLERNQYVESLSETELHEKINIEKEDYISMLKMINMFQVLLFEFEQNRIVFKDFHNNKYKIENLYCSDDIDMTIDFLNEKYGTVDLPPITIVPLED